MTLSQINNCIAEFDETEHLAVTADFRTANLKRDASDDLLEEARSCLKTIKENNAIDVPVSRAADVAGASASLTGVVSEGEISTKRWSEDEIKNLKAELKCQWNALGRDD
eukprot:scaffold81745_cov53-Cyclotella_meneghiniana.AAC.3